MPFLQKIQRDRGEPRAAGAMNGDAEFAPIVAGEAEFVTGSRRPGSEETKDPIRRADVRFFALMVSVLTGQRISDTTFGLRAMRAEVTGAAPLEEPQYQASELPITVITHGYMVLKVPATIHKRKIGESKKGHNFNYGLRFMRVVITTWWRERRRDARGEPGGDCPRCPPCRLGYDMDGSLPVSRPGREWR